jgi:SNF2 family DNA or RNA helicase
MRPQLVIVGDLDKPRAIRVVGGDGDLQQKLVSIPGFNYTSRDPYNFAKKDGEPVFPPSLAIAKLLIQKLECRTSSAVQKWYTKALEHSKSAKTSALDETPLNEQHGQIEPYPYQNAGIRFLRNQRRVLLCDEMGLGKTGMALRAAAPFIKTGRVLVITRKYLIPQWIGEVGEWLDLPEDCIVDLSSSKKRAQRWSELRKVTGKIVFINWDALSFLNDDIVNVSWDWVIADEAHAVKNRKTQRAEAFKQLTHPLVARNVTLMTGTPVEKSPADMFPLLQVLYPTQFTSYWAYFCTFADYFVETGLHVKGAKNTELLHDLIAPFYLRRTRAEKLSHLKEPQEIAFPVPFEDDQMRLYEQVLADAVEIVDQETGETSVRELTFGVVIAQLTRLRQVGVLPALVDPSFAEVSNAKADALVALVQDLENEHILVYTSYRLAAQNFCEVINKELPGTASVYLSGLDPAIISRFGKGGRRVLITTVDSLGEGTNLQASRVAIFADLPWSGTKYRQAVGRIVRPGQEGQPLVYHLLGPLNLKTKKLHADSIDKRISDMHRNKEQMFNEVAVMRSFLDERAKRFQHAIT